MEMEQIPPKFTSKIKSLGINIIYLFGSEAQGTANFASDVDFGIVFDDPSPIFDHKKYSALYDQISDLISEIFPKYSNRQVDLVFIQRASYLLQFEVIKHGKILFENDPEFRADYELKVMQNYYDIKPLLEKYYQATLERIK